MNAPAHQPEVGAAAQRSRSPNTRAILWAGIAVLALVVIAFASTFMRAPQLDPDTPEGVVQRYLQAAVEGRRTEARSYLSDRLQRECERGLPRYVSRDAYRIELMAAIVEGTTAEVEVMVAEQDAGVFDGYYEFPAFYSLVSTGDGWRITDQDWPWRACSERTLDWKETP